MNERLSRQTVRGRAEIAALLHKSEKTITRWAECNYIKVAKEGPHPNSPMIMRSADVAKLREQYGIVDDDAGDA